jgi:glycerate kinase
VKFLLAPDKFKDALDARGACDAMAAGIRDVLPQAHVIACPMGDGGEGTGPLLAEALRARERRETVLDALGRECPARWWLADDGITAVIEMAEASGLWRLAPAERCAMRATSYGTGQLIHAALSSGARKLFLCVGGSATVDGGAGCLQALGWRMLDGDGRASASPLTGADLQRIATLQPPASRPALEIEVLCDVDNPLLGPRGAAPTFGPQKGASPTEVQLLASGLTSWAGVLKQATGCKVADLPRAGAAGGLPAGLFCALGARLVSGFDALAQLVMLRDKLRDCDWCLTGEGRLDEQTFAGKVGVGVTRLAAEAGVPTAIFVGAALLPAGENLDQLAGRLGAALIQVISPSGLPHELALAQTAINLRRATAEFAKRTIRPLPEKI